MRTILHSDLNSFYASVECLYRPELRDKPVAVGGSAESRHGIILAKNNIAKPYGIRTGEALWQARQKCPNLVIVQPNYQLYLRYSEAARFIYSKYTDKIESFGLDECWLDVSESASVFGDGKSIAEDIRKRIKEEMGITVSIGVSYNKIFAKLGSDLKKPDAVSVISKENYKDVAWSLPVEDLLYVGPATKKKLHSIGVTTIGALANLDYSFLRARFGKWGDMLYRYANGLDQSIVKQQGTERQIKGIGNSTTTARDLVCDEDVGLVMYVLCESVAMRLTEHGLTGRTLEINVRDNELFRFTRQGKLDRSSSLSAELHQKAMELFRANYDWSKPIRSVGVRVTDLSAYDSPIQLSLFDDELERNNRIAAEKTMIDLRKRFGHEIIGRAKLLGDPMGKINPKDDHIIHPIGYFKEKIDK